MSIETVNDTTFNELVLNNASSPILVDFWAEWCGPCKMLAPIIDKISEKYSTKLKVYKLDTEQSPVTAQTAQITSIPCCIIYKNGKEVHRIIGHQPQPKFELEIEPYL
jgi:thioredoxin 1